MARAVLEQRLVGGAAAILLLDELDAHLDIHATADRDLYRRFGIGAPQPRTEQLEEK